MMDPRIAALRKLPSYQERLERIESTLWETLLGEAAELLREHPQLLDADEEGTDDPIAYALRDVLEWDLAALLAPTPSEAVEAPGDHPVELKHEAPSELTMAEEACLNIYSDLDESEVQCMEPSIYDAWSAGRLLAEPWGDLVVDPGLE